MTLRKFALFAVALPFIGAFFACNSEYEPSVMTASSAAVSKFSLTKDDSVIYHLDSVYFSIDLNKGLIFNADSLPYGTNVSRLIPIITTLETASVVELQVKRANGTDTTYNYLENTTDSIDFTNPVNLRVVSYDGLNEYNYTVKVNVHKMVSDSLSWARNNESKLPTTFTAPTAQRTVLMGAKFYCLTQSGSSYCLAKYSATTSVTNSPLMPLNEWSMDAIYFPFTPKVDSFASCDGLLFILSNDGLLYWSDDEGESWQPTSMKWGAVYGSYGNKLLGAVEAADGWYIQSYPDGSLSLMPEGMPVEGFSAPVKYSFPMSSGEQMVIVGGRTATGSLTGATWGYDGSSWVKLSNRSLPTALEGVAVASYYSFKTSSSWNVTTYPTLLAFGGRDKAGVVSTKVYMSNDYGVNWRVADETMQLPPYIADMAYMQAFVLDSYYSAALQPKIAKPTETWACPYIYLFGGYDSSGRFQNVLWRGVVNRLSFPPLE